MYIEPMCYTHVMYQYTWSLWFILYMAWAPYVKEANPEKISFFSDFVKIALSPPPWIFGHQLETFF